MFIRKDLLEKRLLDLAYNFILGINDLSLRACIKKIKTYRGLGEKASIDARDEIGHTALMMLAAKDNASEMVTLLIEAGANPNSKDQYGRTAIFFAVTCCNVEMTRILISVGADVTQKNDSAQSALDICFIRGLNCHVE